MKSIVKKLVTHCGTNEPFEICDSLGIKVVFSELGNKIMGFYQKTENVMIIHINNNINDDMKRCICAHELGHAIVQPDMSISFFLKNSLLLKNKYEIQADLFAAELLLGDKMPDEYLDYTIEQVAAAEKIPVKLVELKIKHSCNNKMH